EDTGESRFLLFGRIADDVKECVRQGHRPDLAAYVSQHSQWADEIRELVATLSLIQIVGPDFEESGGAPTGAACRKAPLQIGDFRILREIGRGGMGVVYEAEQLSLSRRVALKVLPFASVIDPRHVQRFKNEALAAAQIEHPHIVGVYGVGHECGVHYYAM